MSRIAFLGYGTMGQGMVSTLARSGHTVTVWNRTPLTEAQSNDLQGSVNDSIADAVRDADFVMMCVSNDQAVAELVLTPTGLPSILSSDSVVIDLSTIDPETSDAEAAAFAEAGIDFIDAPVFGSKGEAASGGLWVVAGGSPEVFERAKPILEAISETVHYMGLGGSGARMKLVGNLIVAAQLEAIGESLALAQSAGLNLHDVLDVFRVTDFRSPIIDGVGAAVVAGDYSPSFALKHMLKDARLVTAFAERLNVPVPGTQATLGTIEQAVEAGWGEENASALIKVLARGANVDLTTQSARS